MKENGDEQKQSGLVHGMTPEEYQNYVKQVTPVTNTAVNVGRAFAAGGSICLAGEMISRLIRTLGCSKEDTAAWVSILLIGISVVLTGLNLYTKIVKWAGAGALVPITGFANAVASAAIEAQVEGQVFGIGCQIFKIAGPVILYGVFSSWILGIIYWIFQFFVA